MNATEAAARGLLTPHLWPNEDILWCDLPQAPGAVAAASARQGFLTTVVAVSGLAGFFLYFGLNSFDKDDPGPSIFFLVLGGSVIGAVLTARTLWAWLRGRRAAIGMAYGVTNRRVLIARGEELDWVGPKQLEGVEIRGQNVVVTRQQSEIESLWNPDAPGFDEDAPGQELVEKANAARRELTLAALHDPQRVAVLIQTLKLPAAS